MIGFCGQNTLTRVFFSRICKMKDDFRNRFEHSQYWSDDTWKNKMTGGGTIKYFNTELTRQDKKFLTFELFEVIQDAIQSILHFRTMY